MKKEHPIAGRQYQLTGGTGEKCLSNGNTWEESEVEERWEEFINDLKRKQLQKLYKNNLWEK